MLQLTHQLKRDRGNRFDYAAPVAIRALLIALALYRLSHPLAGHLHEADARYIKDLRLCLIVLEMPFQCLRDGPPMIRELHVYKVDYYNASEVPELELAGHLFGGLDIGLEGCIFQVSLTYELSGIHIYGYERFGLIEYQISARLQLDDPVINFTYLLFDIKFLEERDPVCMEFQPGAQMRGQYT